MKKSITDLSGNEVKKALPEISHVKPIGNQILVEVLTPDDLLGPSKLHMPDNVKSTTINGAPQGYILAIGPKVDATYGFEVGDRVVLSGAFTPLPEVVSKNGRPQGCVEPHMIKAVLVESKPKTLLN
jgi:hypothetical protein